MDLSPCYDWFDALTTIILSFAREVKILLISHRIRILINNILNKENCRCVKNLKKKNNNIAWTEEIIINIISTPMFRRINSENLEIFYLRFSDRIYYIEINYIKYTHKILWQLQYLQELTKEKRQM